MLGGAAAFTGLVPSVAFAQGAPKIKIGLMLPYTGTYAQLGVAIENGFRLAVQENGGKLGGRELEYFEARRRIRSGQGADNANRLVNRDKVDVLVGHGALRRADGHGEDRARVRRAAHHPECGRRRRHRRSCARRISSAPRSPTGRPAYPMGKVLADRGVKKVVTLSLEICGRRGERRGLQGRLRQGRRQDREGTLAAVPERGVPAAADRDRIAQARRGVSCSLPAAARSSSSRTTRRPV